MIDIIAKEDVGPFSAQIEAMHRLRHLTFKERLGWDVKSVDGLEIDEYDSLNPVYLLAVNDRNTVIGTWRLLPTTGPNMLRDTFPELLRGAPAPESPTMLEASRFAVHSGDDVIADDDPDIGGLGDPSRTSSELFCGLVEYCLACGITEIVTVYDIRIARLLPRIGCKPRWQSPTLRIGKSAAKYGVFDINERVLADIREAGGITQSVIRYAPWSTIRRVA
jgi:acyl homoserine lactone synthase